MAGALERSILPSTLFPLERLSSQAHRFLTFLLSSIISPFLLCLQLSHTSFRKPPHSFPCLCLLYERLCPFTWMWVLRGSE